VALLFTPGETRVRLSEHWYETKDGDREALALYLRHYSANHYRDGRPRRLFVGPGEKLVLVGADADALFVWRRFVDDNTGRDGVNCAVFRNEGPHQSSALIREAEAIAWERWPGQALYTYVNSRKVQLERGYRKPGAPGHCFLAAGWKYELGKDGQPARTKDLKLHVLWKHGEDA
jgi:hypothetical protein